MRSKPKTGRSRALHHHPASTGPRGCPRGSVSAMHKSCLAFETWHRGRRRARQALAPAPPGGPLPSVAESGTLWVRRARVSAQGKASDQVRWQGGQASGVLLEASRLGLKDTGLDPGLSCGPGTPCNQHTESRRYTVCLPCSARPTNILHGEPPLAHRVPRCPHPLENAAMGGEGASVRGHVPSVLTVLSSYE